MTDSAQTLRTTLIIVCSLTAGLSLVNCAGHGVRVRKREAEIPIDKLNEFTHIKNIGGYDDSHHERLRRQSDSDSGYWSNWDSDYWSSWDEWYDNWKEWLDSDQWTGWTSWDDWNNWSSYTTERYESGELSTGAIVGIVAGALAVSCLAGCCKAFLCSKKNENNNNTPASAIPISQEGLSAKAIVGIICGVLGAFFLSAFCYGLCCSKPRQQRASPFAIPAGQSTTYSTSVTTADGRTMRTHQIFLGGQPINTTANTSEPATAWEPPPSSGYPPYPAAPGITVQQPETPSAPAAPAAASESMPPPPSYDQAVDNPEYISPPDPATNQLPTYNDYIKSSPYASQERIGALSSSQVQIHDGAEEEESPANADTPLNSNATS